LESVASALIVFACVFGGAVVGMVLNIKVPDRHLEGNSSDVVKLIMGLIGTMTALILGLVIASAKNTYDSQNSNVVQLSASFVELDRILANYGSEAKEARTSLQQNVIDSIELIWPRDSVYSANLEPTLEPTKDTTKSEAFLRSILALSPRTDEQRITKGQALQIATDLYHTRLLMYAQEESSVPLPFLISIVLWLVLLFVGFGLLSRFNGTLIAANLLGALSVAIAIYLIVDLDRPYTGLIRISSAPVQAALAQMNK